MNHNRKVILLISTSLTMIALGMAVYAEDVKPPVTVDELKTQLSARDKRIAWLEQKVTQTEIKMNSCYTAYNANESLHALAAQEPKQ